MKKGFTLAEVFHPAEQSKKIAFTLAEVFHPAEQSKKIAFTLAEVLITLGIIGVVAALTIPSLIQNHKKHVVETRLAKFYSSINQAITLSEVENGDKKYWNALSSGYEKDNDGNDDKTKPNSLSWFNKYLKSYLKYTDIKTYGDAILVHFADGSLMFLNQQGPRFYIEAKNFKTIVNKENGNIRLDNSGSGKSFFTFKFNSNKGMEPYMWALDGDRETLKTDSTFGCNEKAEPNSLGAYCTALIMLNGWKIPKDYPLRF